MKYQVTIGSLTTEIDAADEMEAIRLCRLQCPKDTGAAVVAELPESHESDEIPLPPPVVSEPINASVVESVVNEPVEPASVVNETADEPVALDVIEPVTEESTSGDAS